jgi:hypothetical protein
MSGAKGDKTEQPPNKKAKTSGDPPDLKIKLIPPPHFREASLVVASQTSNGQSQPLEKPSGTRVGSKTSSTQATQSTTQSAQATRSTRSNDEDKSCESKQSGKPKPTCAPLDKKEQEPSQESGDRDMESLLMLLQDKDAQTNSRARLPCSWMFALCQLKLEEEEQSKYSKLDPLLKSRLLEHHKMNKAEFDDSRFRLLFEMQRQERKLAALEPMLGFFAWQILFVHCFNLRSANSTKGKPEPMQQEVVLFVQFQGPSFPLGC